VAIVFSDMTPLLEFEKAKTDFISVASHQLQGPLSGVRWYVEILLEQEAKGLTNKQLEYLDNIDYMNKQMIEMVNSLLNISRIDSGRIIIDPEITDMKILVEEVIKNISKKIELKELNFSTNIPEDLPKISVDPRMLKHVYNNLLSNAIKYTPRGGNLEINLYKQDDMLFSEIIDSGIGIPKEQRHKIFKKFFRASNAVSKETDGTGLGLYLAKAVVDSSRGRIWFESEEGKGSTFIFTIPLSGVPKKEGLVTLT
jgi:signal transduction histidine kinase